MTPPATSQIIKPRSEPSIVATCNLKKQYKSGAIALNGISLNINKGDLFGLIGPDGAGKSTVLRILSGVMEATSGEALIFGKAPRDARKHIGYVPQNFSLYPDLTVEENLRYQAGLYGVSEKSFSQLKDTHLKNMGLLKFSDRLAGRLSGGMKQKLALCCALVSQPQLIILDEPTTGLDPIARRELWQTLTKLAHEGVTSVIATPFLDEAERCNSIALLYEGKIQQTGAPKELQDALHMRRLEITIADERKNNEIWNFVNTIKFKNISDIYSYGDHLEILAEDPKAADTEFHAALASNNFQVDGVHETAPNMENVFIMGLRKLGHKESPLVPFPHIRKTLPSDQSDVAIQAQKVCKNFNEFRAVENINLAVRYGEIYGLLGANGAGKTTTIKMLCGLMEPTTGSVTLAGKNQDLRSSAICKQIGYMSQKFTLYDGLTVEENLQFYAAIYEIPLKLRKQRIDWVTQACELKDILKSVVGNLPLGWKQRIAFGAAVMHEPSIIFLDEPTAGVDPLARRQLWSLIKEFAHNGAAVLVTTHYLDEAEYCNRLAFMSTSKIVEEGSPHEIKSKFHGQIIEIKTNNIQSAFTALSNHLDHWRLTIFSDSIHVLLENSDNDLKNIKSILQNAQCNIESIRAIPCSLEDAFIDVVERSLREVK
jgi:ABC-2 type transport system ATP-binding protein